MTKYKQTNLFSFIQEEIRRSAEKEKVIRLKTNSKKLKKITFEFE